jgi:hypothetical protein
VNDEEKKFVPQTAREALLEIKRIAQTDPDPTHRVSWIDVVADQGLTRTEPYNFELGDHLADRLAEAHRLLVGILGQDEIGGMVVHQNGQVVTLAGAIREVLSLPPDLETMVERRMR